MKKLLALALTLVMVLSLGGAALAEKTEVNIWYYWENLKHQEILNGLIECFNASQEDIEVKASYVPFADFKKQLSIGATADVLPRYRHHRQPRPCQLCRHGHLRGRDRQVRRLHLL